MEITSEVLKDSVEHADYILKEHEDKQWNYYIKAFDTGVLFMLAKSLGNNRFEVNNWHFIKKR